MAQSSAAPAEPYRKASLGGRFLAVMVDGIIGAALLPLGVLLVMAASAQDEFSLLGVALLVIGGLWQLIYLLGRDSFGGAGWGKRLAGIMVVSTATGSPAKPGAAALRQVVMYALALIPAVGSIIEPVMVLIDKDGKRLGDKVAKTQVVAVAEAAARGVTVNPRKGAAIAAVGGALVLSLVGSAAGGIVFARTLGGAVDSIAEEVSAESIVSKAPVAAEEPAPTEAVPTEAIPTEEPEERVGAVNAETAVDAVGNLLNNLKEDDVDAARAYATRGFQEDQDWFFSPAGGALIEFEVSDVYQDQAIWVVETKEQWNSGPEESRYFVIEEDNTARVDGLDFDQ